MNKKKTTICELGPIRPPSEASSLLVRVSRNCPWNRCSFCPVYKNEKYEKRPIEDVIREIDLMAEAAKRVRERVGELGNGSISVKACLDVANDSSATELERRIAFWLHRGGEHVFLQDADSLIAPIHRIEPILRHLYEKFPSINRVTTYARSRTLVAKTIEQLKKLKRAGLTRIHVGIESGAKEVLEIVNKGCTPAHHIEGCRRAIDAGFEVCCYVMPGLGGKQYSSVHAEQTGIVLREIDPHYIRLRSLFIIPGSLLFEELMKGAFEPAEEDEMIIEIKTMLKMLKGKTSRVVSDHDFNLLMEIEGHVTKDAASMLAVCDNFLDLPKKTQDAFVLARRSGYFRSLSYFLSDADAVKSFAESASKVRELGSGSLIKGLAVTMGARSI